MAKSKPVDTSVVPVRVESRLLVATPDTPVHLLPSTLPRDAEGIKKRLNCMGQSSIDLDRDGMALIHLQDVFCHWRDTVDESTGEVREFSWLVLIDASGDTFGTSSPVVAEKIERLLALWSAGVIDRPTPVQVLTRTGRKTGRRYHDVLFL